MSKLFDIAVNALIVWILAMAALGITIGMYKYLTKPNITVVAK